MVKGRKRLTRKEIKEDEVAQFFLEASRYVQQHSRKFVGLVLLAMIALIIVTVAVRQRRAAELEAQSWVARANLELKQGNVTSALQGYSGVAERYRGTWGHSDASFFAANANFAVGRYDSALVLFETYLNLKKRRAEFTVSCKQGIAQCLEQLGRYSEAAEGYLKVQREHPASPLAPDALFGAGRCYELAGDLPLAERTYSELIDLYPDSNQAGLVKLPLLEIQAKLEKT